MHSLPVAEERGVSLGGRVAETERSHGGVAVHQTTGVISGTTSRTSRSLALVFPETVEFLGRDEILSGGESTKRPRDPDLHILDLGLDPLPFSASSSCSSSSALVPEGLTRLDCSLDLAKLPVEHKDQVVQAYGSPVLVTSQQARTEAHDSTTQGRAQHPGYTQDDIPIPYLTTTRWKKSDETRSGTSVTFNSSSTSCNSESDPDDRPSSASYETFFDPSPSSAEASPTSPTYPDTANHNDNKNDTNTDTGTDNHVDNDSNNNENGDRFVPPVPTMVPELSESINSKLSSATPSPTSAGPDGTTTGVTNMQWRPRSAPKTSYSRSASPLLFWNRKGNQQQQHQQQQQSQHQQPGAGDTDAADWFVAETREGDDATYVDSISNHLGKMTTTTTTPAKSGPGTLNGWADLKDSTLAAQEENQATAGTPPSITREEYEALPLAIQRKYFSALERLRFEQDSSEVDRIYNHYDLTSHNSHPHPHSRPLRKHRAALSSPDSLVAVPKNRTLRDSRITTVSDDSWVLNIPEKVSKAELTREEQVHLIKHLRASVILDAANEALSKAARANDRSLSPTPDIDHSTATLSSRRGSLDSMVSAMAQLPEPNTRDAVRESLYDSFRWLDEEEDLDLGLFLDDYHANLRDEVPQTGKHRRPSFRRHLSISKLPFGRTSLSANAPLDVAKDAASSPVQNHTTTTTSTTPNNPPPTTIIHTTRRLSRTLSIINPSRHAHSDSSSHVIDPTATHYQDPEARHKLRAYLASPSKFDEAIQFGFPTRDSQEQPQPPLLDKHRQLRTRPAADDSGGNMRSFLDFDGDEDDLSDHDDASSVSDPDSPKTPQMGGLTPPPGHHRPTRISTDPLHHHSTSTSASASPHHHHHHHHHHHQGSGAPSHPKPSTSDSYTPYPTTMMSSSSSSSREMTLRMTLTRPDLRANEELIYGWQPQAAYINPGRKSPSNLLRKNDIYDDNNNNNNNNNAAAAAATVPVNGQTTTACWSEGQGNKESIEHVFAGLDHWSLDNAAADRGVMKRIWNKVRRA